MNGLSTIRVAAFAAGGALALTLLGNFHSVVSAAVERGAVTPAEQKVSLAPRGS